MFIFPETTCKRNSHVEILARAIRKTKAPDFILMNPKPLYSGGLHQDAAEEQ